tara:strand:- start:218 stop:457 length:240 start_codon:yes stop_codon:yes gene_type:complete
LELVVLLVLQELLQQVHRERVQYFQQLHQLVVEVEVQEVVALLLVHLLEMDYRVDPEVEVVELVDLIQILQEEQEIHHQ